MAGPGRRSVILALAGAALSPAARAAPSPGRVGLPGVNLAGGEFGDIGRPLGQGYVYPPDAAFAYYARCGLKLVRVPFKIERVQPEPFGALSPRDLGELERCVEAAAASGLLVVLDAHNFGKRHDRPIAARDLADLWSRLARHFRDRANVAFGLMNEPAAYEPATWRPVVDVVVAALRQLGSAQRLMVPGAGWSGAHSWIEGGNAAAFEGFDDPNFLYEVHQYLDHDRSGRRPDDVLPGSGSTSLAAVTDWARRRGQGLFLGEFGFALPASEVEARALLGFMGTNSDVWRAYAYWAGGPWWGDYAFSIEPDARGDKPQMTLLRGFL